MNFGAFLPSYSLSHNTPLPSKNILLLDILPASTSIHFFCNLLKLTKLACKSIHKHGSYCLNIHIQIFIWFWEPNSGPFFPQ